MEIWVKILEVENFQVLLKKQYNVDDDQYELLFEGTMDGMTASIASGFKSEKSRDEAFESDKVIGMAQALISAMQKL